MKKSLLSVISICCLSLLNGCGTSAPPPPPPVATHFSVSAPATITAGTAFQVTVSALDSSNNVVPGYSGTVHFASTDAQAVLPANSPLTNGSGSFSVVLKTATSETITVTDTGALTGTSSGIAVSGGPATRLSVSAPSAATAAFVFHFSVTAFDAYNNVATGYAGMLHFSSSDSQAVLPMNSALTNGTGTFPVTLNTIANTTVAATDTAAASLTLAMRRLTSSLPLQAAPPCERLLPYRSERWTARTISPSATPGRFTLRAPTPKPCYPPIQD